ncbi:MAG: hypothetical protein AAGF48_13245 [Pseudomonadota bacterium]
MKRYLPKVLTFSPDKKFTEKDMEDVLGTYTLEGWEIAAMTHMQGMRDVYTFILKLEIPEEEYQKNLERRA